MPYVERTDEELRPLVLEWAHYHVIPNEPIYHGLGRFYSAREVAESAKFGPRPLFKLHAEKVRQHCKRLDIDPVGHINMSISYMKSTKTEIGKMISNIRSKL